jgi:hypothetical protein
MQIIHEKSQSDLNYHLIVSQGSQKTRMPHRDKESLLFHYRMKLC